MASPVIDNFLILQVDCLQTMGCSELRKGRLTVLTGPSGVGKGTLMNQLLQRHPEIWVSISATTRPPRPGEVDGKHYFFYDRAGFADLIARGGCLEWAEFAGNCYGTPRQPVQAQLAAGRPVLLEIELEGARQVRKSFPDGLQIFLAPPPPGLKELERRIRRRGMDAEEAIVRRLNRALEEMEARSEFDAIIINDDLDIALKQIEGLMA